MFDIKKCDSRIALVFFGLLISFLWESPRGASLIALLDGMDFSGTWLTERNFSRSIDLSVLSRALFHGLSAPSLFAVRLSVTRTTFSLFPSLFFLSFLSFLSSNKPRPKSTHRVGRRHHGHSTRHCFAGSGGLATPR